MTDEETVDEILDGGLKIHQSRSGYRFNLDSLILAHFAAVGAKSVNLDLGCGNGVIALILARRFPHTQWHGLEIQAGLAALARRNVKQNGLDRQITIDEGNAKDYRKLYKAQTFDNVIFNPPYRRLSSGRINPHQEKAIARHEVSGSLDLFLTAAGYLLKPKGRVFTIYPATRLPGMISLFRKKDIEPKRMKLVFSNSSSDAAFVLIEGRSTSREALKIEPPLFIYEGRQQYSQAMQRMFIDLSSFPSPCAE